LRSEDTVPSMTQVLILTAAFGEGHNAAARGLQGAFARENLQADVVDLFSRAHGPRYDRSRKAYLHVVNKTPWLWAAFFRLLHRLPLEQGFGFALHALRSELQRVLEETQPRVVISVYPLYACLFEALHPVTTPHPPFFTVITDSLTINAIWYRVGPHPLLLPNTDTLRVLEQCGVPRARMHVSGFPVSPRFADPAPPRPDPGEIARPKVLLMVNGQPEQAVTLVQRLQCEDRFDLTVTVGRDAALGRALEEAHASSPHPPRVLGWVDEVPSLLRAHHVLIGKAGGATVQETLAAGTPMLMTQIFPGQEEGNARLLIERDCGAFCATPGEVIATLHAWFAQGGARWREVHQNTLSLGNPNAALETVRWIVGHPRVQSLRGGRGGALCPTPG
jgi:processive 1,2-diacylglycerol beta-glucosyltransferase